MHLYSYSWPFGASKKVMILKKIETLKEAKELDAEVAMILCDQVFEIGQEVDFEKSEVFFVN